MKRLLTLLLAVLMVAPAFAEDKEGGTIIIQKNGGMTTLPTAMNQFLGANGPNPEWETLSGGSGNCTFTRTSAGYYQLNCPLYLTGSGGGGATSVGPNPPMNPVSGQQWFNSNDLQTYIYYNGQWIPSTSPCPPGGTGSFAPLVNPTGGQNNYAPLASPNFTGTVDINGVPIATTNNPTFTGTSSFTNLSVSGWTSLNTVNIMGNLTFNGNPVGGTCPSGEFVNGLSSSLTLGCAWPPSGGGGGGAPATNPPGGSNNYAPIDSPIFTGTSTFTNVSVSGTTNLGGTVTMPDGSTWSSTKLTGKAASFTNLTATGLTVTGTVSLPNASITEAMLAGAYSGVGACPANQVVNKLNRDAAPTCIAVPASGVSSFNGRTGAVSLNQSDLSGIGYGNGSWGYTPTLHGHIAYGPITFQWGDCPGVELATQTGAQVTCNFDVAFSTQPFTVVFNSYSINDTSGPAVTYSLTGTSESSATVYVYNPATDNSGAPEISYIAIGPT